MYRLNTFSKLKSIGSIYDNPKIWGFRRQIHGEFVSNKDLYLSYGDLSINKVKQNLSLYPRCLISKNDTHIRLSPLERIDVSSKEFNNFKESLRPKIENFKKYLEKQFELSEDETIAIICGLVNFELKYCDKREDDSLKQITEAAGSDIYSTGKLRALGKQVFEMQMLLSTVFTGLSHLTTSAEELKNTFDHFNNERFMIPQFMKRNLLYESIHPVRGACRTASFNSLEDYTTEKLRIHDATCIGSFYTMLGILLIKFDKKSTIEEFLRKQVIEGPSGMVSLATDRILEGRE